MASISCVPIEVVQQILDYLTLQDLLAVRQLSRNINRFSTVNHFWQPIVLDLLKRPILADVRRISHEAWAFSHQQDGWFRAYLCIMETSKSGWIPDEDTVKNTSWAITFIGMDLIREIPEKPHSIVRFSDDMSVYTVGGHPLVQHKWWIANGTVRVPAYPPLRPERDKYTWGRLLKHIQVLMHATSPEFLENLLRLNKEIIESTADISAAERTAIEDALELGLSDIRVTERDESVTINRLEELHFARRQALRLAYHIPEDDPADVDTNMADASTSEVGPDWDYYDDEDENEMFSGSDFGSLESDVELQEPEE